MTIYSQTRIPTSSWCTSDLWSRRWQSFLRRCHDRSFWRSTSWHGRWDWAKWLSSTRCYCIVIMQVIVGIEKLFKPLDKLKVVLESAFWQFLNRNDLHKKMTCSTGGNLEMKNNKRNEINSKIPECVPRKTNKNRNTVNIVRENDHQTEQTVSTGR